MGTTMRGYFLGLVAACAVLSGGLQAAESYEVDAVHSSVIFRVKHLNISYSYGRINNPTGTLVVDEADPAKSSIVVEVKSEQVDTDNEKRDQHLRGPDFFNAKQFPSITFKSKTVKKADDKSYEVTGDLTLLGVTKELKVTFARTGTGKDPWGGTRIGFEGSFTIKRSDFGMKYGLEGVGDEVQLTVSIEGAHKAAAKEK